MKVHKLRRFRFKYDWGWSAYAYETWCPVGFMTDNTDAVDDWARVTCKRCLRMRKKRARET